MRWKNVDEFSDDLFLQILNWDINILCNEVNFMNKISLGLSLQC